MIFIERKRYASFQWAGPPTGSSKLEVERRENDLVVRGLFPPARESEAPPLDLISHYETARKNRPPTKQRCGKNSPHIRFANATTDAELIEFVRSYGPVVAKSLKFEMEPPFSMIAIQDLQELRKERVIYKAALALVLELRRSSFDCELAERQIAGIASDICNWPHQWQRECSQRKHQPCWRLSQEALTRIQKLAYEGPPESTGPIGNRRRAKSRDTIELPPDLDGRIVLCELLNSFPSIVFPNVGEAHSSIWYGIRPLLYSILRREFIYPHNTEVCANDRCGDFFEVERSGQRYCNDICSQQQRQREYWSRKGKKLRRKRLKKR
jgi:hypothetical protein